MTRRQQRMTAQVKQELRAISKLTQYANAKGQLTINVQGTTEEWEGMIAEIRAAGWDVYRHYVNVGNIQLAILLD